MGWGFNSLITLGAKAPTQVDFDEEGFAFAFARARTYCCVYMRGLVPHLWVRIPDNVEAEAINRTLDKIADSVDRHVKSTLLEQE